MAVKVFAPAKVNLTLHVTGQRGDGYHLLDSLVAFADVGDEVSFTEGARLSLTVRGPEAVGVPDGESNSILKAARFMGCTGGSFSLIKNLPTAAGIGGGTADAAAVLRVVSTFTGRIIPKDVLALGADVPVCLRDSATRMSGVGEVLKAVPALPPTWAVLANPRVKISTPDIFKSLPNKKNQPMPSDIPAFDSVVSMADWLQAQRNDLQGTAIEKQPVIGSVLLALSGLRGQLIARMSGSGATCFALFETEILAQNAAQELQQAQPDWWVAATRLS